MEQKKQDGKILKGHSEMKIKISGKIFVCFLVPIGFMILVGVISFTKAKQGLNEKFADSTQQTIGMAVEYLDVYSDVAKSEGMRYAFDKNLDPYFLGVYKKDPIVQSQTCTNTRSGIMAAQSYNSVIGDVHMLTNSGIPRITT